MKHIIIRLDAKTHKRLKVTAAEQGTSIQQIVARLVQEFLERHERGRPPRRPQPERGR
jgi:predicted HicB family RNase H-like nuclease